MLSVRPEGGAVPEGQVSFVGRRSLGIRLDLRGSPQAVAPYEDSTRLTVPLLGNGLYTLLPERTG
ncbi:MAG: hypothetical protein ACLUOS_12290 [Odoribacter splanchnicus]